MAGKLAIVPTPIGNVGDMPPRAADALRAADVVMAEDTRVTGKLLSALGIEGKRFERLDENLMGNRAAQVIERVQAGEVVAYCTDAGMPGVSDPGLRLVACARHADPPIVAEVLPGPSAAVTAYVASGTTAQSFYFGGFLPRKDKARRETLESLARLAAALIFYESPNRLVSSLAAVANVFPHREVAVCRELTKLHEEVVRDTAGNLLHVFSERDSVKGEIALVIDPPAQEEADAAEERAAERALERARELSLQGERPKSIAAILADEFGVPRNTAYGIALKAKE